MTTLTTPLRGAYRPDTLAAAVDEFHAAKRAGTNPLGILRASWVGPSAAFSDARAHGAGRFSACAHTIRTVTGTVSRAADAYFNVVGHRVAHRDRLLLDAERAGVLPMLRSRVMFWRTRGEASELAASTLVDQAALNLVCVSRSSAEVLAADEPAIARILGPLRAGADAAVDRG